MNSLSSSIFGRLLSNKFSNMFFNKFTHKVSIAFNKKGLAVTDNKLTKQIQWNKLTTPLNFEFGFFGQTVSFSTADQSYKVTMMAYASEYLFKARCEQYWLNGNIARLDLLLSNVAQMVNQRFLRQSSIPTIKALAGQEHSRWLPWIKKSKTLAAVEKQVLLLDKYARWNNTLTVFFQERYVQEQLAQHKLFFDHVETKPLTEQQRRACIIDDDNNLLLAGAGTGKTSVMVGRAGFLVESKQAQYDDILLLAYGRKAADEMDQRIQDKLATDKIKATTFHSVGLHIIAQVERKKPSLCVFAEDEKAKAKWAQQCFETFIEQHSAYRVLVLNYFSKYYYVEKNDVDFTSLGDYYQYLNDNDVRSLKGDKVKSFGELYIANWLFYHGIDFVYEAAYQFDLKTVERRQYKPDFYLPEYDLYIEYYGIDENGNTAPAIDKEQYHAAITWKKASHARFDTLCITLTYAQHKQGVLLSALEKSLVDCQISVQLLPIESLLASLKETGRISVLAALLGKLLGLYKAACLDESAEIKLINSATDPQQITKALELLKPILSVYNKQLAKRDEIDFEDMIIKALGYVESGQFTSPWRYIMVDEFQDISEPRARLVKALRDNHSGSSVFAVGDDWQAIYRFSGADIRLTTQFEQYFGFTTKTALDLTFRFNNKIGQVASHFISKNPMQLAKNISSLTQVSTPAVSLLRRSGNTMPVRASAVNTDPVQQGAPMELTNGAIDEVLQAIYSKVCAPVTVFLLARFWFQLPSHVELQRMCRQYPLLKIQTQSFHGSKGKEADYVVMIGLQNGKHGFPSEKATPAILDALLPPQEQFAHAEERRLFYVALTRAKHRVYLVADMANISCFVHELIAGHDIELDEFISTSEQINTEYMRCINCEKGHLKKQTGRFGIFYSCSLFPRCEHKEQPCEQCASVMTGKRHAGFKSCINTECNHIVPVCDKCDAEMMLRTGPKGEFWGCRNFKGDEALSCKNGKESSSIQWPELVG
ncbi:MAG: DNA helicase-4 [Alteromonadaceae bacterium]|jgi:DNA helicase-4